MAEDKSKTVIVKDRAKAFLTSKPEDDDLLIPQRTPRRPIGKAQKAAPKASEIAASIRKTESPAAEAAKKETSKVSESTFVEKEVPMINRGNKLLEDGRVKKIPACKMAEPMKRPADDTLIIAGKVTAASKKIQMPVAPAKAAAPVQAESAAEKPVEAVPTPKEEPKKEAPKPATKKAEPKKEAPKPEVKKEEPKKEAAKPAAKKSEPKKEAPKPAAKKAEPKKETSKPEVKKAEPKKEAPKPEVKKAEPKKEAPKPAAVAKNTYIQYQNESYDESKLTVRAEKIWTGELKKKAADLKTLELYVKPQEKMVYCVFNKKETGSFAI